MGEVRGDGWRDVGGEKVLGKEWESVLGCRESKGRDEGVWGSVGERCGKVC